MEDLGGEHMKSFVTRISYKMLITTMMTILLSFFVVTSCVHANKFSDLVNEDGIYYTGTQEAKVTIKGGIFDNIINTLSSIANYLLGLMTIGIRAVFIGWIELAEMFLTWVLDMNREFVDILMDSTGVYSQNVVNVESILFNKVPILNANIFENVNNNTQQPNNIVEIIRVAVAKWYYILRLIAIAFMLLVLIFVGIKMAISTIASEKAVYKQMLVDWVAGMIIVFTIHYMMIAIFAVNDSIIAGLQPLLGGDKQIELEEYQYGIEKDNQEKSRTYNELETTLYESARTRAYSLKLTDGFTGMIIYGVLVYYAWRFAIKYFIRVFNIMILTLVAPVISASYALNKVMTGKSKIFSGWLTEYIVNVIVQMFHVIIYVSFVAIALKLSAESLPGAILAFVLLHFMLEGEKFLRTLFKMSGSKGSLSGEMDRIGLQEIKSGVQGLKTAMVGGKIGSTLMKGSYRLATKPIRAAAETAFGNYMVEKANEKQEEEKKKIEEEQKLQETINQLKENQAEKQKQMDDKELDLAETYNQGYTDNSQEVQDIRKEMNEVGQQLEKINDQLEEKIDEQEYLNELKKIQNLEKIFTEGTLEGTIANLFDPKQYVTKGEDGKYHRMKTLRKGGVKGAFWRKKVDSIGMRFMENAKLQNILNLSSEEVKELKEYYKIQKSNVVGFVAGIVGFPALVVNPTLGIALLGQAGTAGLRMATKRRQIKNRPSYKKSKNYNFIAFNKNAKYTMQVEAARQIQEIEQTRTEEIKGKHQNFIRKLVHNSVHAITLPDLDPIESEILAELGYSKYTKQFKTALKQLNELETSMNTDNFKNQFAEEEKNQKELAEQMSEEELLRNEYANDDSVVTIGNTYFGIDIDNPTEEAEKNFIEKAEKKMSEEITIPREEKLKAIKYDLRNNQQKLIQNQIQKYYARRGVTDISNAKLESEDSLQIKANILGLLEEKGIIKKGEIKADESFITTENIQKAYTNLQNHKDKTNERLEQILATDTVLEYMRQTGITDKNDLSRKTDEIYDLMKDKMMSEDSKKTADVIRQLSGQDKKKEEIKLSDYMKQVVDKDIKKVKKVKRTKKKEDLVKHETNRRMNATKKKLEEALYADTTENIDSQNVLDMLFALSKIGENNRVAIEVNGKKKGETKKEQLEKLEFYQDGTRKLDKNRDGSRRFDQSRDGSQRVVEELFMETKKQALEKRLFGPEQNVIDLLNNV